MNWRGLGWELFYLSPAIPLALVWQSIRLSPESRRMTVWIPATVGTTSVAWIGLAFFTQSVLGPGYSNLRGWIIVINLAATALTGVLSFLMAVFSPARRLHVLTGAACIVLGLCWMLTLAANVAV